jgi:hypothetical protein
LPYLSWNLVRNNLVVLLIEEMTAQDVGRYLTCSLRQYRGHVEIAVFARHAARLRHAPAHQKRPHAAAVSVLLCTKYIKYYT